MEKQEKSFSDKMNLRTLKNTINSKTKKVYKTGYDSLAYKNLPKGCQLCVTGRKSVLFVTGKCSKDCFYCPLSENRKNKDVTYINEKKTSNFKEIISEIKKSRSKGASITGGEPLEHMDKTLTAIKTLKKELGKNFHIHLYTSKNNIPEKDIKALENAGLDEIRFHIFKYEKSIDYALKTRMDVGIEIPVIPNWDRIILKLIEQLNKKHVKFINLNELEFSTTNSEKMKKHNIELKDNDLYIAKGSRETALRILKEVEKRKYNISVHFCTSTTKFDHQYWNRLKHRAKSIKKPYEKIIKHALLEKGLIKTKNKEDINKIIKKLNLKQNHYKITKEGIELSLKNLKKIKKLHPEYKYYRVEELPTEENFYYEMEPI